MQCPNCQFENMPGNAACGRCGTSLQLATTAIAVHPPRAGTWQKRLRNWFPWRQRGYAIRDLAQARVPMPMVEVITDGLDFRYLSLSTILRLIVPGWAQSKLGLVTRGRLFFLFWLAFLLPSIVCFGSTLSGWCFGFAVAVHAMSVADLFVSAEEMNPGRRIALGVFALAAVAVPYWLLVTQITSVLAPREVLAAAPPLEAGDVYLYWRNAYAGSAPQVGDVVLYRNRPYTAAGGDYRGYRNVQTRYDGEWIDRIVAAGGSHLRWEHGQLWVDGKLSPFGPLNPTILPETLEVNVPAGCYCILPTTIVSGRVMNDGDLATLSIVDASGILGRVAVRSYPLHRWSWIE